MSRHLRREPGQSEASHQAFLTWSRADDKARDARSDVIRLEVERQTLNQRIRAARKVHDAMRAEADRLQRVYEAVPYAEEASQ